MNHQQQELLDRLTARGCDVPGAMERMGEDVDFYRELLDQFLSDDLFEKLGDALSRDDRQAAFQTAHTLKGVLGNLGLTPLYGEICSIVEPLRNQSVDQVGEHYARLMQLLKDFRTVLEPG